jgi:hypothetical protein
MTKEKKITRNMRERTTAFVYVFLLFAAVTFICCWGLFYYTGGGDRVRKELIIGQMERIRAFQNEQSRQLAVIESIYERIDAFDPGVSALHEENDIRFYLNRIADLQQQHQFDERYRIFAQVSAFYLMWFADKKELWSKQQNIIGFRRNLEECRIGLERRQDELRDNRR